MNKIGTASEPALLPRRSVFEAGAYVPPLEGRREHVRLDFNENTRGFPDLLPENREACTYPEYAPFLRKLSSAWSIPEQRLLLTNGSGEAIFLTAFTFIEPGIDRAVTSAPTFALIPHSLRLVGALLTEVPCTREMEFDLRAIESVLRSGVKIAMLASPDNPTGAVLDPGLIRSWCERFPATLFYIDEAYFGYHERTALPLLDDCRNLMVSRTFSKAYGMAGMRMGAVAGDPQLVAYLKRVRAPYSVNTPAMAAASRLLDHEEVVLSAARATIGRKEELVKSLCARGWRVRAGHANFYLIGTGFEHADFCSMCRERGVLVRDRSSSPGLSGRVRITVGTEEENSRFLETVDHFQRSRAIVFDLDGTLVDTSRSYDAVIEQIVARYSARPLAAGELRALRAEGGFNDDWDAITELLRRRDVFVERNRIADEGEARYLSIAPTAERLLVAPDLLRSLALRHPLFILTGRYRNEYEPIWANTLDPLFVRIFCRDDLTGQPPKPAPDMLIELKRLHDLRGGVYVGNSVDDMAAARAAGFTAIGVTTQHDGIELRGAGAEFVIDNLEELIEGFQL